jgi:predicted homoserine dehydrogenase-like protein
MGRGIARQMFNAFPGLRLAVVANRTLDNAKRAYEEAGVGEVDTVASALDLERSVAAGRFAITDDPIMAVTSSAIEIVVEVTGTVEQAAHVVEAAIRAGKHVVLMNAELDGTIGPILKVHADAADVILSACDGDQPGVQANLYRFVKGIGLRPLVCGNIKGLHDPYRNPTTQEGYAKTWGLGVAMVTSFADGTKVSYEQAIVANGTGMRAPRRGLYAWEHTGHVDELTTRYELDDLEQHGGIVDYVIGAQPAPGVYVIATHDDPLERHYMKLYKRGEGPLYSFYTPQHLCHFEVPTSIARVALLNDTVLAPLGGPVVEVIATAKRDLQEGETIDGIGGYLTYGQCDNADAVRAARLLPMGIAEGCRLRRPVVKDQVLTYDDVDLPPDRLVDRLRTEQEARFSA